jgi:DNA-directed RNA polymerase subunit RPC12/RpoP
MVEYVCFNCGKKISDVEFRRRIRCPYCGSKILIKKRQILTKVKAR